jgi:hypothetical protein
MNLCFRLWITINNVLKYYIHLLRIVSTIVPGASSSSNLKLKYPPSEFIVGWQPPCLADNLLNACGLHPRTIRIIASSLNSSMHLMFRFRPIWYFQRSRNLRTTHIDLLIHACKQTLDKKTTLKSIFTKYYEIFVLLIHGKLLRNGWTPHMTRRPFFYGWVRL